MGKYELTKSQWTAVMKTTPWLGKPYVLDHPNSSAIYITWHDAKRFCKKLITLTKRVFRLPTEAEWEYAARGGTSTRFYWGDDPNYQTGGAYAWWRSNAYNINEKYAHIVGQKLPNNFVLYDMIGNVWEWCEDEIHRNYKGAPVDGSAWVDSSSASRRIWRGSGWNGYGPDCRCACRPEYVGVSTASGTIGFRLAGDIVNESKPITPGSKRNIVQSDKILIQEVLDDWIAALIAVNLPSVSEFLLNDFQHTMYGDKLGFLNFLKNVPGILYNAEIEYDKDKIVLDGNLAYISPVILRITVGALPLEVGLKKENDTWKIMSTE